MAYSPSGPFGYKPTRDPNLGIGMARSEAYERANYLSRMDQYFEGLKETRRQFDISHELERDRFGWEQERFGKEHRLAEQYFLRRPARESQPPRNSGAFRFEVQRRRAAYLAEANWRSQQVLAFKQGIVAGLWTSRRGLRSRPPGAEA